MDTAQVGKPSSQIERPLRLWPAVLIVVIQWLGRFGLPVVWPDGTAFAVMAGMAGAVAVVVWWLFFSRAPWSERLLVLAVIVLGVLATPLVLDESIATGAMGGLFLILASPALSLALVLWAALSRGMSVTSRRAALVGAVAIACGMWALVRTGGFTGNFDNDLHWRWAATPEERLLAQEIDAPLPPAPVPVSAPATPTVAAPETGSPVTGAETSAPVAEPKREHPSHETAPSAVAVTEGDVSRPLSRHEWPSFRGADRNGVVRGVRIETDWSAAPPRELWRRPIGPGWSSFTVSGDLFYTQEQRGEEEVVAAYKLLTGEPVWRHRDAARFWESNGGAGPRGTPTLSSGRVYALGATGILNVLDAATGARVWSRNAAADTQIEVPMWGFSSSPLVLDDLVIVGMSGTLAAYDRQTGAPRWTGPRHSGDGYSSPQPATIDGVSQVLLTKPTGITSVEPASGAVLWEHTWQGAGGAIVQPAVTPDGDVLIGLLVGMSGGSMRRLSVRHEPGAWTVTERWTTLALKPYFNDFVVHKGHAYGFDGSILACIDVEDGTRKWKGGRYGAGQLVLLSDQDLLLVTSEEGELALVSATPDGYQGIARVPGIEGKTWNHPVVVGDILLVRNGEEMAAFRLPASR